MKTLVQDQGVVSSGLDFEDIQCRTGEGSVIERI